MRIEISVIEEGHRCTTTLVRRPDGLYDLKRRCYRGNECWGPADEVRDAAGAQTAASHAVDVCLKVLEQRRVAQARGVTAYARSPQLGRVVDQRA